MVEHVYHHTAMQIYYWIMLIREETRILILKFAHVIVGYSGKKVFSRLNSTASIYSKFSFFPRNSMPLFRPTAESA